MTFKKYSDEDIKDMIRLSKSMEPQLKLEAKAFLDRIEKRHPIKKDGTMLRKLIFEQLGEFPMMTHYGHLILEEAKSRGYEFKDEGEKLI